MSMAEAIASAKAEAELRQAAGFDQVALDEAARQGFAAGAFEETVEDGAAIVEEFYPDEFDTGDGAFGATSPANGLKPVLADKLNQKAALMNGHGVPVSVNQLSRPVQHGRE